MKIGKVVKNILFVINDLIVTQYSGIKTDRPVHIANANCTTSGTTGKLFAFTKEICAVNYFEQVSQGSFKKKWSLPVGSFCISPSADKFLDKR